MDKVIFIPSAVLGLALLGIYWYRCHMAKKEFNTSMIAIVVLQASGIICGLVLIVGTFYDPARDLLRDIEIYILISGLFVIATSAKSIKNDIFVATAKKAPPQQTPEPAASQQKTS